MKSSLEKLFKQSKYNQLKNVYSNPRYAKITKSGLSTLGTRYSEYTSPIPESPFPSIGDTYEGGIVFEANTTTGEIGILNPNFDYWYQNDWATVLSEVNGLTDGGFSDWRLPSNRELALIFGNAELRTQLDAIMSVDYELYWSIEEAYDDNPADSAYAYDVENSSIVEYWSKAVSTHYGLPIRRVNFYGLPLIGYESNVFVINANIASHSIDIMTNTNYLTSDTWENSKAFVEGVEVLGVGDGFTLGTPAQLQSIFADTYLARTIMNLPYDNPYWSNMMLPNGGAMAVDPLTNNTIATTQSELFYALPVKTISLD